MQTNPNSYYFKTTELTSNLPKLSIAQGVEIVKKKKKYLGIIIDQKLSFALHIENQLCFQAETQIGFIF